MSDKIQLEIAVFLQLLTEHPGTRLYTMPYPLVPNDCPMLIVSPKLYDDIKHRINNLSKKLEKRQGAG